MAFEKSEIKLRFDIGRKVYEKDGVNIGEAIYRPDGTPWWGITPSVVDRLKKDGKPYRYNFIHKGHGGISCTQEDLDILLRVASKTKDGGYRINFRDFEKVTINGKWMYSLNSELEG